MRRLADGLGLNAGEYSDFLARAQPKAGGDSEMSFGRWLQQHRKALDLAQAELATRVGYAAVTIHKIETDRLRPSREMANKLADAFAIALTEREAFLRFARGNSPTDQPSLQVIPPRSALPQPHHNLPLAPTRFLGRGTEVQGGTALLSGDVRLLTLTGAGGIGKTRLGQQVAAALIDSFPDGVWFVDLAPLADPGLFPTLVTSRVALRITGEVSRPVGPLALPPEGSVPALDQLERYAAVHLFLERTLAVQPRLAMTDQNTWALVRICHRLDGMPLALELAAARTRVLSLEQIATRLDDRSDSSPEGIGQHCRVTARCGRPLTGATT